MNTNNYVKHLIDINEKSEEILSSSDFFKIGDFLKFMMDALHLDNVFDWHFVIKQKSNIIIKMIVRA